MTTLAIDFDGVIHVARERYQGPAAIPGEPVPGALQAVLGYKAKGVKVVVHTARARSEEGRQAVATWLKANGFPELEVTATKPHAAMYLDDRAKRFDGTNFPSVNELTATRPWHWTS
jgi:hypothetical protein